MPFSSPSSSVKALKEKVSHSMNLLTPSSPILPTVSLNASSLWGRMHNSKRCVGGPPCESPEEKEACVRPIHWVQ